jgi:hypothetical protein
LCHLKYVYPNRVQNELIAVPTSVYAEAMHNNRLVFIMVALIDQLPINVSGRYMVPGPARTDTVNMLCYINPWLDLVRPYAPTFHEVRMPHTMNNGHEGLGGV